MDLRQSAFINQLLSNPLPLQSQSQSNPKGSRCPCFAGCVWRHVHGDLEPLCMLSRTDQGYLLSNPYVASKRLSPPPSLSQPLGMGYRHFPPYISCRALTASQKKPPKIVPKRVPFRQPHLQGELRPRLKMCRVVYAVMPCFASIAPLCLVLTSSTS